VEKDRNGKWLERRNPRLLKQKEIDRGKIQDYSSRRRLTEVRRILTPLVRWKKIGMGNG